MANAKNSGDSNEFITVDTAPGVDGYWTNSIMARFKNVDRLFFSIREEVATASAVVTLQYKCEGDEEWQDYYHTNGDAFVVGERFVIEDWGATDWRAGIKSGGYTSGTIKLGIDW